MTSWTTHELDQIGSSPKPQINRNTDGRQNLPVRPLGVVRVHDQRV
jgi:hypothetical protein